MKKKILKIFFFFLILITVFCQFSFSKTIKKKETKKKTSSSTTSSTTYGTVDYENKKKCFEIALRGVDYEILETLINEKEVDIDIQDNGGNGETLLMKAIRGNKDRIINFLLENNANVNIKSNTGDTAFSSACYYNNIETIKKLIEYEADYKVSEPIRLIEVKNYEIKVFLLEEKMVDIDLQDKEGNTALMKASSENKIQEVELLLKYNPNLSIKNNYGWNSFECAEKKGHKTIMEMLNKANK